jgi:hypothetical protein
MKKIGNVEHLGSDEKFLNETKELARKIFKSPNNSRSEKEVEKSTTQGALGEWSLKESIPGSRFGDGIRNDVIGIMDEEEERLDTKTGIWDGTDDDLPVWWNIGGNGSYDNIYKQAESDNLDAVVRLYINKNTHDIYLRWKADAKTFKSYVRKSHFDKNLYYDQKEAIKNGHCIEYSEEA